MKILKINSLMIRIWMTFTGMILIIICCISFLYVVAFRSFDESAKIQDMKVAHDMLVKSSNFQNPLRFDKLKNLRSIENLIVNINGGKTQITDINNPIRQLPNQPQNNTETHKPLPPKNDGKINRFPPPGNSEKTNERNWIISFIKYVGKDEMQFREYYNNIKFFFIISPVKSTTNAGKSYVITYMPYFLDNSILYKIIIIGIVFITISFFTAKFVAGYISKPLKELENYTKRIANKHWGEPIKVKSNDEIGSLANSMNVMQKKLKYAEENEKLFLQSISHDLKTPVMVIMSHAEAIIDGIYIDSIEKTAEIIKNEAINLEKKVKQILYLNTLEYMLENSTESENMNLQDILNDIVHRFEAFNSSIKWELNISKSIIWGNKEKVTICIENILDNALRYAKTTIKITLKKENKFAVIEIYNDGNAIESENIERIFDSMYKGKKGNFGLGLAISKKVIDFYNGYINAVNRENGVSFIIKYPIKSNY
ncbi:ATP-binding protein [Clostridium sp. WILCCON 0269]|uniref:histidine kinase n=1 Tax=Candidatus Clostridium eludens TaxID=3381663 RepID=A0ABW8SS37_9CLOT